MTLLYWGDCANGRTSHSTRAGYVVDALSEEIVSTCKWYAPGFAGMRPDPGRAFPFSRFPCSFSARFRAFSSSSAAQLTTPLRTFLLQNFPPESK